MLAALLFLAIGVIWMGVGVALIAAPEWWRDVVSRSLRNPARRFALTQVTILIGLVLIIGTAAHPEAWLWITLGTVAVIKGVVFLGAPERIRNAIIGWWVRTPVWTHRLAGVLLVALAAFLAVETLRAMS